MSKVTLLGSEWGWGGTWDRKSDRVISRSEGSLRNTCLSVYGLGFGVWGFGFEV